MTIIAAIKDYIAEFSGLPDNAPVWVNHLGALPIEYSIVPLPGGGIVYEDLIGNTEREYPFALQSAESTADELERLESMGFYEAFAAWLEQQTEEENLPDLGAGKTPRKIEALGGGSLFEQGESATGIYQIQAKLTYEQAAYEPAEASE